ncbi:MAG: LenF, partial [uncultured bacterium]
DSGTGSGDSGGSDGGSSSGEGGFVGSPIDIPITSSKAVEDLPYISGSVNGGTPTLTVPLHSLQKGKVATKAAINTKTVQKSAVKSVSIDEPSFSIGLGVPDGGWDGKSLVACESQNDLKTMVYETANFDVQTCHIKTMIEPVIGEDLYDGEYHYFEYDYAYQPDEIADVGLLDKIKVRYVRDADGNLTNYRLYGCTNSAQTLYLNYDISGSDIEIQSRSTLPSRLGDTGYDPTHIRQLVLTGTLDPEDTTQYATKSFSLVRMRDPFNLDMDVVQTSSDILFNTYEIQGSYNVGLYASVELFNPDDPDVDPLDYSLGSGAGTIYIPGILDPETLVECWDGTSIETTSCLSSLYYEDVNGQTPKSSVTSAETFSGDEVWDCAGTVEDTFDGDESTACDAFVPDTVYGIMSCAQLTGHMDTPAEDPTFTLSVAGLSGAVSTPMAEDGSTVEQALDASLVLTFGLPVYNPSLNTSSVKLFDMTDNCDWGTQIDLTYTDISDDDTLLTLSPTLTSGHRYALVVATSVYGPTSGDSSLVVTGHYTVNHDSDAIYSGGENDGQPVPLDYIVYYFSAGPDQSDYAVGDEPVIFAIDDTAVTTGIAGADAACNANKPTGVTGYFRALLVDGVDRVACVDTNDCAAGQVDWVFLPSTEYRKSCDLRVGMTNASALFDFPMDHPFSNDFGEYAYAYTGLSSDWTTSANTCLGWTSSSGVDYGASGKISQVDSQSITGNAFGCSISNQLICVEQIAPGSFTVGGSISGQTGDVTLQNNAGDNLVVTSVATTFEFVTSIDFGLDYEVTVLDAPAGQRCVVTSGSGAVLDNVNSVVVTCSDIVDLKIFVTDLWVDAPSGIADADATCMADANKPIGGSTFKAMIADGVIRRACSSANCVTSGDGENIDWVLQPSTTYKRVDDTTIGTTDANGIFSFPLDNAFTDAAFDHGAWTGLA